MGWREKPVQPIGPAHTLLPSPELGNTVLHRDASDACAKGEQ